MYSTVSKLLGFGNTKSQAEKTKTSSEEFKQSINHENRNERQDFRYQKPSPRKTGESDKISENSREDSDDFDRSRGSKASVIAK